MSPHLVRLAVPTALGLGGFLLSQATIDLAIEPVAVLAVTESIPVGGKVSDRALTVVTLPGKALALRADLIPATKRGVARERVAVRALEPNQLLLYSDLDVRLLPPPVPEQSVLVWVPLDKLACRREMLRPGGRVAFLVRSGDAQGSPRIGPFLVYDWPAEPPIKEGEPAAPGPERLGVLVDKGQSEVLERLRAAIGNDALRGIEMEGL